MATMKNRSPLRELWDEVTRANDWSIRDVVKRIEKAQGGLKRTTMNELVNSVPLLMIKREHIVDLALGLGISPDRVAAAAFQSMGFRLAMDEVTPAEAIARDAGLSDDTRRAILAILHGAEGRRRA